MRLYRYVCKENGIVRSGETWNTSKEKVIQDVKGNFSEPTNISVVWLKPDTFSYRCTVSKIGYWEEN